MSLSELEREFINNFQGNFPLQERPFKVIAARLNCSEDELIDTVKHLKSRNLLTRFGPLYDAASLGGGLTLAAIAVPEERYDSVTEIVNAYSEVAHNYRREHTLNMWFVLATETPEAIDNILHAIEHDNETQGVQLSQAAGVLYRAVAASGGRWQTYHGAGTGTGLCRKQRLHPG